MDQNAGCQGQNRIGSAERADKSGNSRWNVRKLYFFPNLSMIWITAPVIVAGTVASENSKMSYRIFSTEHQGQVVSRKPRVRLPRQPFSTQFTAPDQPQAPE